MIGLEAAQGYENALDCLRSELGPTLHALERLAADPAVHDGLEDELPHLQYALHVGAERALGIEPLPGLEEVHNELLVALAIAREETAHVAETVAEAGPAAADALVWEWRGALFAVRLALQRLHATTPVTVPLQHGQPGVLPVLLVAVGVVAVLGGAVAAIWPIWALGLVLVTISTAFSGSS